MTAKIPLTALAAFLFFILITMISHPALASASISAERWRLAPGKPVSTEFVLQTISHRKDRIQKVLVTLDRVAQVTQTMKPESAGRIEPVIVDLAEQTIDLSNDGAIRSEMTDVILTKLEITVNELVRTVNRYVEPEMSL